MTPYVEVLEKLRDATRCASEEGLIDLSKLLKETYVQLHHLKVTCDALRNPKVYKVIHLCDKCKAPITDSQSGVYACSSCGAITLGTFAEIRIERIKQ